MNGDPAPVSATASSGLTVTLMVDPSSAAVCTLSEGTVSYAAAGSCVIDASQAGNATWAPAQDQHTITVTRQSQSITINAPAAGMVGDAPAPVSATASSDLQVTLIVDPGSTGVCTLSGGAVTYQFAGSCVIDASQDGDATYAPAKAQWTIKVTGTSDGTGGSPPPS